MSHRTSRTPSAASRIQPRRIVALCGLLALGAISSTSSGFSSDEPPASHNAPAHAAPARGATPAAEPARRTPRANASTGAPANTPTNTPTNAPTNNSAGKPAPNASAKAGEKTQAKETAAKAEPEQRAPSADSTEPSFESTWAFSPAVEAMTMLREGNQRWVGNQATAPNTQRDRMEETANKGQHPQVTIITCSDSRIPVERVFDRGVGDLFVIRVAGNRAGDSETGTVEYGVEHLKTPLLLVMGHTKCGAVAAAASKAPLHGKVAELVQGIEPAIERARRSHPDADATQLAALGVKENVWQTIFDLYRASPTLRAMAQRGEVKVIGGVYDIATGRVEFMGEHPWQTELLSVLTTSPASDGIAATATSADAHPLAKAPAAHDSATPTSVTTTANAEDEHH